MSASSSHPRIEAYLTETPGVDIIVLRGGIIFEQQLARHNEIGEYEKLDYGYPKQHGISIIHPPALNVAH